MGVDVAADHVEAAAAELQQPPAGAAGEVENALAAGWPQDLDGERGLLRPVPGSAPA